MMKNENKEKTIEELKSELEQLQKEKQEREEKNKLLKQINNFEKENLNNFLSKALGMMGNVVDKLGQIGNADLGIDNDFFVIDNKEKPKKKTKKK